MANKPLHLPIDAQIIEAIRKGPVDHWGVIDRLDLDIKPTTVHMVKSAINRLGGRGELRYDTSAKTWSINE